MVKIKRFCESFVTLFYLFVSSFILLIVLISTIEKKVKQWEKSIQQEIIIKTIPPYILKGKENSKISVEIDGMQKFIFYYNPDIDNDKASVIIDSIIYWSKRYNLDPWLVLAVAAKESSFDQSAMSNAGAIGIMQVMDFWRDEIRKVEGKRVDLYKIDDNIHAGCYVLSHYLKLHGNVKLALAAYNGSIGSDKYPKLVFRLYEKAMKLRKLRGEKDATKNI